MSRIINFQCVGGQIIGWEVVLTEITQFNKILKRGIFQEFWKFHLLKSDFMKKVCWQLCNHYVVNYLFIFMHWRTTPTELTKGHFLLSNLLCVFVWDQRCRQRFTCKSRPALPVLVIIPLIDFGALSAYYPWGSNDADPEMCNAWAVDFDLYVFNVSKIVKWRVALNWIERSCGT